MKKICMITHDAPYIDRRILLQAKALIENGYEVSIIHPFGEANSDFENIGIEYITIQENITIKNTLSKVKGIIRKTLPQSLYNSLKSGYFKMASTNFIDYEAELLAKATERDYNIYVAHDLPALPIAHSAAKEKNALLVYDAHEFFTGQIALQGNRKIFFEKLENKLIRDVDLMFTVNKDIAKLFEDTYDIKNIHILYNAMEKQNINKIVNLHTILKIEENKHIVLYQGGFLEDRNLELLVKSSQYFPENIVLVMLGYSFLEEKLKTIAKKLNILNKNVYFMDRVPQKELLSYTAGANFGIIPYPDIDLNTKYCTPNKMFEFLTANVPMIGNNALITVEHMFQEYNLGTTISFKTPKSIAEGITKSINSMNVKEIKKALKESQTKLSWEAQEEILIKTYNKLEEK
jgi:glycosyltransferase involved in cell wall biosynthesis